MDTDESQAEAVAAPTAADRRPGRSDHGRTRAVLLAVAVTLGIVALGGCCVLSTAALAFGAGWFVRAESAAPNFTVTMEQTLDIGDVGTGTIERVDSLHLWYFEGQADQWVLIRVEGLDGCDPHVGLTTEDGLLLAEDDDGGGGYDAVIHTQLPADGIYAVRVGAWSVGDYDIVLDDCAPDRSNSTTG